MKPKTQNSAVCPCQWQAQRLYADCCGRYTDSVEAAPSAEALMRSRYSAFVREQADYLLRTWHPSTRPKHMDFEPTQWLGLQVEASDNSDDNHATVTFGARYKVNGKAFKMHETSRFVRENGAWLYVDGDVD